MAFVLAHAEWQAGVGFPALPPPPDMSTASKFEFFGYVVLITAFAVFSVKFSQRIQLRRMQKHRVEARAQARAQHAELPTGLNEVNVGPPADFLCAEPVQEQFLKRAAENPQKIALVATQSNGRRWEIRYGEMAEVVHRLAKQLAGSGVGDGSIVVLALERGVHQVVAVYASMLAHAAWTPVDPAVPEHRFAELVNDSQPALVLREDGGAGAEIAEWCRKLGIRNATVGADAMDLFLDGDTKGSSQGALPASPPSMTSQALLIYTSGTTGKPKGIVYSHAMVNHGAGATAHLMEMTKESIAFLKTPAIWAVAEWELFPALTRGGTLVVGTASGHKDPQYMADTIRKEGVTCLVMAPDVLDLLLDIHEAGGQLQGLKHVISVGAGMPVALANRFVSARRLPAQLHNVYGASESSCTIYTVPREGIDTSLWAKRAPVGVPQPGCSVYLLNAERSRVPVGQEGEVCFGGQLAVGYWNLPDLTALKFTEHPELGRLYCSGDVAKWRNGVLEICGRKDRQVKIRGVRVEPEEVENALYTFRLPAPASSIPSSGEARAPLLDAEAPGVSPEAAATSLTQVGCVATTGASPDLVAFVAPDIGEAGAKLAKQHLQSILPAYYVPKYIFSRAELPRLANGKVDVKELAKEADKLVGEGSAQVVMDSLGRMRNMSKAAMLETQVIHRCYTYWMLGVMCDHWNMCGVIDFAPYCLVENLPGIVPSWVELFMRQVGNDQDMFGFIFLGALQDSRLPPGETQIKFRIGYADFFCFLVYLLAGFPIPQILWAIFGSDVVNSGCSSNWIESSCSGHRWYLFMIVWTHLCMFVCQLVRLPGWAQALGQFALAIWGPQTWFDPCAISGCPTWLKWTVGWFFPYAATSSNPFTQEVVHTCPIMYDWIQWYVVFYVFAFYYSRPIMKRIIPVIDKIGLNSASWAVAAFGASVLLGSMQAAFHYPNVVMESGIKDPRFTWTDIPLEFGVNMLQPILIALSMAWFPFDVSWWGNSTLGTYLVHFYFFMFVARHMSDALKWVHSWAAPVHGVPQIIVILAAPILFMSTAGPLFHYILLSPSIVYRKVGAMRRRLQEAREVRSSQAAGAAAQPAPPAPVAAH